jgi:uncharacterized glyoxalase superfamily protein PhnB
MSDLSKTTRPGRAKTFAMTNDKANIIPALRYNDAPRAIEWLCEAFGFEKHLVVENGKGGIAHAQLVLGQGMIMLSSGREDSDFGELQKPLASPEAVVTMSAYVVVPDCDAHHDRARAAGATIVMAPRDEDYGGRGYTCRDLEGHVWSFGTYDPWAE